MKSCPPFILIMSQSHLILQRSKSTLVQGNPSFIFPIRTFCSWWNFTLHITPGDKMLVWTWYHRYCKVVIRTISHVTGKQSIAGKIFNPWKYPLTWCLRRRGLRRGRASLCCSWSSCWRGRGRARPPPPPGSPPPCWGRGAPPRPAARAGHR